MKKFGIRMAALALCLLTMARSLSSCGFFIETFLSEYTGIRTQYRDDTERTYDILEDDYTEPEDITVTDNYGDDSWYYPWDDTTRAPETTRPPETTRTPETTVPETTNNIPDELESHVFFEAKNNGRCDELVGNVHVTIILINDNEAKWDDASVSALESSLSSQEKKLEDGAAKYGKSLDITYSYITVSHSGVISSGDIPSTWQNTVCKSAGFSSLTNAQKELDASNGADSNPIAFVMNKTGRAYANWQFTDYGSERLTLFSSDVDAFSHELCHLYGAQDYYYPELVEELSEKYLPESIMCHGDEFDALTSFTIGWDDELDSNAYNFLKETAHLTKEYLDSENEKQQTTGYVTDFKLSYGIYTGYLDRGIPMGKGSIKYDNGDVAVGNFIGGDLNGNCHYKWANGDIYEGDFVNGKRTGKGTYTWSSGGSYTGDFVDGKRTGKGTQKWSDGSSYVGDFVDNVRMGKGRYTFADGTYYDGDFVNGKFEGQGTYVTSSGFKYVGAWKDDNHHGYGKATYSNGSVYDGYFVNGKREGNGTMRYADGDVYVGTWKAGNIHGQGTYTFAYGHKYVGAWENGSRTGYGVMNWSNGSSYDGYWYNNKRHGYGKYINQYGQIFEGQWENDVFNS